MVLFYVNLNMLKWNHENKEDRTLLLYSGA
jgi:hypothetical protein